MKEEPWVLASVPQPVQAGRMDLDKCGRTGVWGELLPRVREPQGGRRSTGGHQMPAVLLGRDSAGRGLLGPVRGWRWSAFPPASADQGPALPSAARGSPRFPSTPCVRSFSGARGVLPGARWSVFLSRLPGENTGAHFCGVTTPASAARKLPS